jgi:hypothetical protein
MKNARAAGPKTELIGVSIRMQQSIEDMIASFSIGVSDCLENARRFQEESPYDNRRSNERDDATKMVATTAELLVSIAKLKGEFSHNYHIVREQKERAQREEQHRRFQEQWNAKLLPAEEVDAMSDEEYAAYCRRLAARDPEPVPPGGAADPAPDVDADIAALHEEADRIEKMLATPPPENRGSNNDAGKS